MDNHEWNPITTAPKGKPILVTDDESVWFGCYTESPIAHCRFFEGADLQSGETITISVHGCKNLTGWLPAPETMWEPQETGEEMLQELGYKRGFLLGPEDVFLYERPENKCRVFIQVMKQNDGSVTFRKRLCTAVGYAEQSFEAGEILAVAQLIREMEATDNG